MATYTLTPSSTYNHQRFVNDTPMKLLSVVFDGAQAALVKGSAVATTDVYRLMPIPAGAFVLMVTHDVLTAEGGTCTYNVGDGTDPDGWVAGANGNSAATRASSFNGTTTPTFGVGKYYSAADTLDIAIASGTAANVVIKLSVTYILTNQIAI